MALSDAGQLTKALPLYEETLQLRKAKLGPDHPSTLDSMNNLAGCQIQRGFAHLQHGRLTEDEVACRECRDVRKKLAPDAWTTFTTESMLGEALLGQKKYAEAEPLLLSSFKELEARKAQIPPGTNRLREAGERVVRYYEAVQEPAKAAEWRLKLPREVAPPPRKPRAAMP